jgi:hypothetical protein
MDPSAAAGIIPPSPPALPEPGPPLWPQGVTPEAVDPAGVWPADTLPATTPFGRLIRRLSEPGGWFPSDNPVSNETSYLHVVPALAARGVRGGAYIGVGPDQNFSYIAQIRPEIAFLIDIRREALLQHLLLKAAFANAENRLEYLALLVGRPVPADVRSWDDATIDEIVLYLDTVAAPMAEFEHAEARLQATIAGYGYPLSSRDAEVVRGIHAAFREAGLGIRYSGESYYRSRRFPTWRQLLLQTDLAGNRGSYLAGEDRFRFVKRLQQRNRVVPVVGDLGGPHALAAIGREIAARGLRVSAFYVSNVEQYLMRGEGFGAYAETVTGLPVDGRSVLIRSYFARRVPIPQIVPGHYSAQLLEPIAAFVATWKAGGWLDYVDLVTRNAVPLGGTGSGIESAARERERGQGRP